MSLIRVIGVWLLALAMLATVIAISRRSLFAEIHGFREATRELIEVAARDVIMAAGTLIGVVFRGVYDELERRKGPKVRIGAAVRGASTSRSFWMAILLSPILLVGFRSSLAEMTNLFLLAVLSYQNGFFFRSVLKHGDDKSAGPATAPAA